MKENIDNIQYFIIINLLSVRTGALISSNLYRETADAESR